MNFIPLGPGFAPPATSGAIQQFTTTKGLVRLKGGQNRLTLRTPQLRWQHCKSFIAFCSRSWADDLTGGERATWTAFPSLGLSAFGRFMLSNKIRQSDVFPFGTTSPPTLAYRTQPAVNPSITNVNTLQVSALNPGSGADAVIVKAGGVTNVNESFHTIAFGRSRNIKRFTYPSALQHILVLHLVNVPDSPPLTPINIGVEVTNVIGPLQVGDTVTFGIFQGGVTDNWLSLLSRQYSAGTPVPYP